MDWCNFAVKISKVKNQLELMAPAGSFECLTAAIQAGANSVYFGVEQLNMRTKSTHNFVLDDLPEIVSICKQNQIKSYLTLNTIVYDHDIKLTWKSFKMISCRNWNEKVFGQKIYFILGFYLFLFFN